MLEIIYRIYQVATEKERQLNIEKDCNFGLFGSTSKHLLICCNPKSIFAGFAPAKLELEPNTFRFADNSLKIKLASKKLASILATCSAL